MPLPLVSQPELVDMLVDKTGWTKGDVRAFLNAMSDTIAQQLKKGTRLRICGIQIEPKVRAKQKARVGRNPRTGEPVQITAKPASVKIGFRAVVPLSAIELPSVKKLTGETETKTKTKSTKNGKSSKKNSNRPKKAKKKGRK